jgi:thiol-disulfide isomerase/thioredoxin
MNRRASLAVLGATALAAGAAGGWFAWRRLDDAPASLSSTPLFALTYPDPEDREQALAQWRGRLLVVNFWATWCVPCIEEMPDLQRVRDEYRARNVEVLGIGIDSAAKIREFREKQRITFPLFVAGAGGSELARQLGNTAGALPYTVLVAPDGSVVQRRLGAIKPAELRRWLDTHLGRTG